MSNFPDKVAAADSRGSGRAPDRSNFTQACNLLSQFLKEKRGSGALSLGTAGKMEPKATTKDLLTNQQNSVDTLRKNASAMEFLPQFVENPCIKRSDNRSGTEPEAPQMTIFYDGKVLVFDSFAPEKATEIMELATKLSSDGTSGITKNPPSASAAAKENLDVAKVPENKTAQQGPRSGPQAIGSDMRYPRRASLLKFLEKRKERVIAKGPYQLNNPKHYEGSSSGGDPEDQSSKYFDLNS